MSATVAPTYHLSLTDGSTLTIGRIDGGWAVVSCCPEVALKRSIDELIGDLVPEQVSGHLRLAGPNPGNLYLPADNSPIDILFEDIDGNKTLVLRGTTTEVTKIPSPASR
jgi:hypothetical protein